MEQDTKCVYAVRYCDAEDAPVVSSDCGISDRVVRTWSRTSYGNLAAPLGPPEPVVVGTCVDEVPDRRPR